MPDSSAARRAVQTLRARREAAGQAAERRKADIYRRLPALAELDGEMAETAVRAVSFALDGGADEVKALRERGAALAAQRAETLRANGLTDADLSPRYACPLCGDTGTHGGEKCECARKLERMYAFESLSAKAPLALSTFEGFSLDYYPDVADERGVNPRERMRSILAFCQKYAADFGDRSQSLLFLGATGLGKTHLSLAIARAALEKGCGVVYGPAQDLLRAVEVEHFGRADTDADTLAEILDCDLLVLDDLGTEFSKAFVLSALYDIVNSRLLASKPCIINTNLGVREIQDRYGERLLSRFVGGYAMKQFFGQDIRYLKAKV